MHMELHMNGDSICITQCYRHRAFSTLPEWRFMILSIVCHPLLCMDEFAVRLRDVVVCSVPSCKAPLGIFNRCIKGDKVSRDMSLYLNFSW